VSKHLCLALSLFGTAALAEPLLINGAGATFPFPLYSKWFSVYHQQHPDLQLNYQAIGSGGGIKQITEGTVDFGASDAPMSNEELAKAKDVVHIPTVLGAVVVIYNLPGVTGLKLTPDTLSGIYLGKITKWNDPSLQKDNPGVSLPDKAIAAAHRSDGSGTTAIFTDYLAKVSPDWKSQVGAGKSVKWPAGGLGGKGNDGVTGIVKQTPGGIGYVELAYANENHQNIASLRNKSGAFVMPTLDGISGAAVGAAIPDDFRVSLTDPTGAAAYPISGFTYLLVHRDSADARGGALAHFLWWALHDGQKLAPPLDYAPLPPAVVTRVEATLKTLTVQGKPVDAAH
jgi:phosphate transport system substrate-binding protein